MVAENIGSGCSPEGVLTTVERVLEPASKPTSEQNGLGAASGTGGTKEVSVFAGSAWKMAFTKMLGAGAGRNSSEKGA